MIILNCFYILKEPEFIFSNDLSLKFANQIYTFFCNYAHLSRKLHGIDRKNNCLIKESH
jgi:hypothetical protein